MKQNKKFFEKTVQSWQSWIVRHRLAGRVRYKQRKEKNRVKRPLHSAQTAFYYSKTWNGGSACKLLSRLPGIRNSQVLYWTYTCPCIAYSCASPRWLLNWLEDVWHGTKTVTIATVDEKVSTIWPPRIGAHCKILCEAGSQTQVQ